MKWHSREFWPPCGCTIVPECGSMGPKWSLEQPELFKWSSPSTRTRSIIACYPREGRATGAQSGCPRHQSDTGHVMLMGFTGDVFFLRQSPTSCPTGSAWSGKCHVTPRGTSRQRNENVHQSLSQHTGERLPSTCLLLLLALSPAVVPHGESSALLPACYYSSTGAPCGQPLRERAPGSKGTQMNYFFFVVMLSLEPCFIISWWNQCKNSLFYPF